MEYRAINTLGTVSALTLGGGGLGQLWGPTTREECVATVHDAVAAGISLFDLAPLYGRGESERVLGEAFGGAWPEAVRVTTKCQLGQRADEAVLPRLRENLERSLEALQRDHVDFYFLHSNIIPDDYTFPDPA
jgi:Predicted oxidoreductases (related to aryl-alcohol dehydrogenases)